MDDEKSTREIVYERSQGVCEICGRQRATDASHRKARSQGGLWSPANILSLCHGDHMWLHRHPQKAMMLGAFVSRDKEPIEIPVWTRHGQVFLHEDGGMERLWQIPDLETLDWEGV